MNFLSTPVLILIDRQRYYEEIENRVNIPDKIVSLLISIFLCSALYGIIIGSFHSIQQAISSGVKLPILYILTNIICFPTLYVFCAIYGGKKNIGQYFVLLLSSLTSMGILLVAFAPITLFFMSTTDHYQFFKLLNVSIFTITGVMGLIFFSKGMMHFAKNDKEKKKIRIIVKLWIILFAFVGSQLGWTLRPFFGTPDLPFELIRELKGNFYLNIIEALMEILGFI